MEQENLSEMDYASHNYGTGRVLVESASDIFKGLTFNVDTDVGSYGWLERVSVREAPGIMANLIIAAIFSIVGCVMWVRRIQKIKKCVERDGRKATTSDLVRVVTSATIDNDSASYTIASYTGLSFFFLAGIQWDYQYTLMIMMIFYILASAGDSLRVLMAYSSFDRLVDVIPTTESIRVARNLSKDRATCTLLTPANIYEDISRGATIVFMVFFLQVILISFVCYDLVMNKTTKCFDGTGGCPIGGTLGSWALYVLGIFMASVYMLGPKTSFGNSEQNPAYWLKLLLATKGHDAKLSWIREKDSKPKEIVISSGPHMIGIWFRFFQSYLINGVGYHILVHALPVQVAYQSSLTSVVFRALGMMYLVDLDDTTGIPLHIVDVHEEKGTQNETSRLLLF